MVLFKGATIYCFNILVDCCVVLGSFYGGQKISNCIDLSYFDVSQGTSFLNIHVDYEVHTLPKHCNEHIYTFSYMYSMTSHLFVYCCFIYHPTRSQLYPCHTILYQKSYNQN